MALLYTYKRRPAYNSDKLLFEFPHVPNAAAFIHALLDALQTLHPIIDGVMDLWMNDEAMAIIMTDKGKIEVSVDTWQIAFIMSDNEACINAIDEILSIHPLFEKIKK
ncbi:MAG: hypothetical protein J0I41_01805 [Filimonas sp.]|nr:hypothetical protein [Filimonas sp.]